jgi:DNA-binding FadR family transcriptional regulator
MYRQLADVLRDKISSGELRPGDRLPSENTLIQEYQLGRIAVRKALAVLRSEGLVVTARGLGSRVRMSVKRRHVALQPGDNAEARMPTDSEREQLELDEGVPVIELRRGTRVELLPADEVTLIVHDV